MTPVPVNHGNKIAMLVFCYVCFHTSFVQAQCIDTTSSPASSANVAFAGSDYAFSTPLDARLNDGYWASAASLLQLFTDKQTDYLQVKNFGFNIPAAASICGIEVHVVKSADNILLNLASVKDYNVRVMKNGSPVGSNLTDAAEWNSSDITTTYGGNGQLWGTTWTPAEINNNNFGFSISGVIHGTASLFPVARVNYISMTVYYLPPVLLTESSRHKSQSAEPADNLTLKCYPNPAITTVQVAGIVPGERVVLSDLLGKILFQSAPAINNTVQLDVAHLQPGMYVVSVGNRKIKIQKK